MSNAKQYLIAFGYVCAIALGFAALFAIMPTPHWMHAPSASVKP